MIDRTVVIRISDRSLRTPVPDEPRGQESSATAFHFGVQEGGAMIVGFSFLVVHRYAALVCGLRECAGGRPAMFFHAKRSLSVSSCEPHKAMDRYPARLIQ